VRNKLLTSTSPLSEPYEPTDQTGHGVESRPPLNELDWLLTAREAADFLNLSIAAFWRNVCSRRLPLPVYPAPRAPRWWRSQLREAVNRTQSLPAEAKAERRKTKLARISATAGELPATE
jgi:hypothetical protein